MQKIEPDHILELRGEALQAYIAELKAKGVIKNVRDLRGNVDKAYRADLLERRARLLAQERANPEKVERKPVKTEPIDENAFSSFMRDLLGPKGIE